MKTTALAFCLLTILSTEAISGGRPSASDEAKVKPACVGIVDGAEWAKCMEKFKSIRPQHEPTKLIFDSYK